jgi:hypothetical protein
LFRVQEDGGEALQACRVEEELTDGEWRKGLDGLLLWIWFPFLGVGKCETTRAWRVECERNLLICNCSFE